MKNGMWLAPTLVVCALAVGCSDGHPCELSQDADGSALIVCPDGSNAVVLPGQDGDDLAEPCEVQDIDEQPWIVCGDISAPLPTGANRCPRGYLGDIVYPAMSGRDKLSLELFERLGCTAVNGNLHLSGTWELIPASLRRVTSVSGNFGIGELSGTPTTLDLSALTYVGDRLEVSYSDQIESISIPSLQHAGELTIYGNSRLTSVDLGIGDARRVVLSGNSVLVRANVRFSAPGQVHSVDWVDITRNPSLAALSVSTDTEIGYVSLAPPIAGEFTFSWEGAAPLGLGVTQWECSITNWSDVIRETIGFTDEDGFYVSDEFCE